MRAFIESNPPVKILGYLKGVLQSGNNFSNVLLTSRGRDAIQLAIDFLQLGYSDTVLLPALTCDTVSGVFSNNCNIVFYDLNEDYSINLSSLERLLNENPQTKVIYVIHYFGFTQRNIREISSLCEKYGVLLIEDHAHSGLSKDDQDFADVYIYSFRKFLPTADGGGICIKKNNMQHNFNFKQKVLANSKGLLITFKRIGSLYSTKLRSLIGKLIQKDIDRLNDGYAKINPLPVSIFGKGIIKSSDTDMISASRRKLYEKWGKLFESSPFTPIFPDLDDKTVPYGFPIKIRNNREIIDHFKRYNIFLKTHWLSMPPGTEDNCPVSHQLARTSITLPVYPGLTDEQMHFIVDEISKYGVPLLDTVQKK